MKIEFKEGLAHHLKNFNVKLFANADAAADADADANANAGGSTIALPGLRPGELKCVKIHKVGTYTLI